MAPRGVGPSHVQPSCTACGSLAPQRPGGSPPRLFPAGHHATTSGAAFGSEVDAMQERRKEHLSTSQAHEALGDIYQGTAGAASDSLNAIIIFSMIVS